MRIRHESIPSVDVFHQVTNVDRAVVDGLGRELIGDEEAYGDSPEALAELDVVRRTVKHILKPARLLRAETVVPTELFRLYEQAGIRGITEEHVDELIEYLGGLLPDYDPESSPREKLYEAPTLPARIEPLTNGLALSIAGSQEMLQERALVKVAILNFYKLKGKHAGAWFEDESVIRAWLARSGGPRSDDLLRQLKAKLDEKPSLLPARADIGGAIILPNPHRSRRRQGRDRPPGVRPSDGDRRGRSDWR